MAIKIIGTDVIDDQRKLKNITDCDAFVGDFHPAATTITTTINFTTPFMTVTLSAATTFTISGDTAGASAILCLDTSSSAHTPTFPSDFNWEAGTEPTWSSYRKWQIYMTCLGGSRIDAIAVGFDAQASQPSESVGLSGTQASPVTFFDQASSNNNDLVMGWRFGSDGNIYKYESIYNVGGQGLYLHTSTQWNNITPSQTYYLRVQNVSSESTNSLTVADSDTINSWVAMTSNLDYRVRDSRNLTTYADENVVFKAEISTTSNGSNIVATGYYEMEYNGLA